MSTLIPFFILALFLGMLSTTYYLLKAREIKLNMTGSLTRINSILKYAIVMLSIFLTFFFCLNLEEFTQNPESLNSSLLINISLICLFSSIMLFIRSFKITTKYAIELDKPSRLKSRRGTIKLGKVMSNNRTKYNFFLNLTDLAQHMFVCGITGTGKSNFIQYFLLNFTKHYDLPFLLTEFKGEYHYLQKRIKDLLILKPGENFSINIFDPEGADPQVHAERIFQIFESGGLLEGVEYSPQMERVFVDILNEVCPKEKNRNWDEFFSISEKYYMENRDLMFQKSVIAIQNRIRRYALGTLKHIFVKKSGINVKEIFDHRVLLDLSSIIRLGGEKEDALFFLNMILKYQWDRNIEVGSRDYEGIKHATIIEDAQYFAPEELSSRTKLTSYLEDIALLLRGTGECLISLATRPKISREILANCGVLVSFQNHMQKDIMQELLNLEEKQKEYLSMLQRGVCIVRVNSIEKPFVLKVPYIKREWLTDEEIGENNKKILESKLSENRKKSDYIETTKSVAYCTFCRRELKHDSARCTYCSTDLRETNKDLSKLKAYINELYKKQDHTKS